MITFSPEQEQFMQIAQTRAYHQGLREGVAQYAHWKNGVQYVGTTGRTLKEAIAAIDRQEEELITRYDRMKQL